MKFTPLPHLSDEETEAKKVKVPQQGWLLE